jgi:membrane fusion protein (multidrug efflux system)
MKKITQPLIAVTIVVMLAGCSNTNDNTAGNTNGQAEGHQEVTTTKSEEITYHPWLSYGGTAYAYREANLGTALPGRVEKIHHQEGTYVEEGQLLVDLSAELYAQALAEKKTLKKDFERVSRLREKGSVTQQKYDHVKAKYKAAKAKARMMRKNCRIRAPFDGTIVDYLVKEGENFLFSPSLKAGYSHTSGIVQLMQLDRLKIKADVNEKDLFQIEEGQNCRVTFDALPDTTLSGKVSHIDPILSTSTHTAKVEVTVDNPEHRLKPGMYANIEIRMPKTTDVFIPLNAIYRQPGTGNDFVFIVQDNRAVRKPVEKLYNQGKKVAVKGISANQQVVVHGKNRLNDGDPVQVTGNAS